MSRFIGTSKMSYNDTSLLLSPTVVRSQFSSDLISNSNNVVSVPSGVKSGDIIFIVLTATSYNVSVNPDITGYTKAANLTYSDNYWGNIILYYKVSDGSETSYSVAVPSIYAGRAHTTIVRNANTSTPLLSTPTITATYNTTIPANITGYTTSENNCLVIAVAASNGDVPYVALLTPTTANTYNTYFAASLASCVSFYYQRTSGALPTFSFSSQATVNGATCSGTAIAVIRGINSTATRTAGVWNMNEVYANKLGLL